MLRELAAARRRALGRQEGDHGVPDGRLVLLRHGLLQPLRLGSRLIEDGERVTLKGTPDEPAQRLERESFNR